MFLILEAFVIFGCLYGLALRMIWPYAVGEHPHALMAYRALSPLLMPMAWSFLAASFFLLQASPFFLETATVHCFERMDCRGSGNSVFSMAMAVMEVTDVRSDRTASASDSKIL